MTVHINDGGTWRQPTSIYVNDGGTWRTIQQIYVNDGGTWRTVFQNGVITISNQTFSDSQDAASIGTATAGVRFQSSGILERHLPTGIYTNIGNWVEPPTAASFYSIKASITSGALTFGSARDTWLPLTSTREWYQNVTGSSPTSASTVLLIQIALTSDTATVLGSASYTLNATLT